MPPQPQGASGLVPGMWSPHHSPACGVFTAESSACRIQSSRCGTLCPAQLACPLRAGVGDTSFSLGSTKHPPVYYEFVGVRSCRDALHLHRLLWASAVLNVLGALLGVLTAAVLGAFKDMVSRAPALGPRTARSWRLCPLNGAECASLSPPPHGKTEAGVSPRASLPAVQRGGSSEVWAAPNHARWRGHRTCPGQFTPYPLHREPRASCLIPRAWVCTCPGGWGFRAGHPSRPQPSRPAEPPRRASPRAAPCPAFLCTGSSWPSPCLPPESSARNPFLKLVADSRQRPAPT